MRREAHFQALFDGSLDAIGIVDDEGRFVDVNPAACRLYEMTRERLLERRLDDFFGGADPEAFRSDWSEFLRRGTLTGERVITVGGRQKTVELSATAHFSPGRHLGILRDVTERTLAEQALRESEEGYRVLFESNPHPVFVCEEDSLRIRAANEAAQQAYGYSLEELRSLTIKDVRPPEEVPALLRRLAEGIERSQVQRHRRKDGTEFPVEVLAKRLRLGGVPCVLGVVTDVTERQQAEAAVQARERHFRHLVEHGSDVIVLTGLDPYIRYVSPSAERALGRTVDSLIGSDALSLVHPDDQEAARVQAARCVSDPEGSVTGQVRLRRGDGTWGHFEFATVNRLGDPDVKAVVTNLRDVTERRTAQRALRLLERAVEGISQGLLVCDARLPDTPLIYVNPGFERLTGYSAQEVLGKNPRLLHGPLTDAETRRQMREALAAGRAVSVEVLNYRKDGTTFWNRTSITPVHDREGRVTHFVGQQLDVTEARRLQEQLLQAQKMEAMGTLAGGIAHDFNNLLMVIGGYSDQMLRLLPSDNPLHRKVEAIRHATDRATGLTRQLLTFSRREVVEARVLDVNMVLAGVEKILRRLVGEHIDMVCLPARDPVRVRADSGQVEQVLMNLVVNARDAMPGGGTLTIEASSTALSAESAAPLGVPPGDYVSVRVADTGVGMDRETMVRIFEPFFTTKAAGKGTGLGLSTVYGIVTHSGGAVTVDSQPGGGTTFNVLLPRTAEPASTEHRNVETVRGGGHEAILVAEDDPGVRELVCGRLAGEGYMVLEARYPAEAVEIAARYQGPIHLLLTDMVMPQMNGLELARRVAASRPATAVLYMSGYVDEFPEETADFLARLIAKPFSMDELSRRVRQELDRTAPVPEPCGPLAPAAGGTSFRA